MAFLAGVGCAATATPDIPATDAAAVPTTTPTTTAIDAIVDAPGQATISAIPTATELPTPTSTHIPVPTVTSLPPPTTPMPTPTHTTAATTTPASTSTPTPPPTATSTPSPTPPRTPTMRLIPTPTSQRQAQNPVFYEQNGLTLEYYWPLDDRSNLSADETEILAYNESDEAVEFKTPEMTFMENGTLRAQFSGTWEKFPSRYSWDRIEYIAIPPSLPRGTLAGASRRKS